MSVSPSSPARAGRSRPHPILSERQIKVIVARIADNKPVRRSLGSWGRLHIDRQLPFLCLYRRPPHRPDPGTHRLGVAEASYLLAPGDREAHAGLRALLHPLVKLLGERFGAFLILELWSPPQVHPEGPSARDPIPTEHPIVEHVQAGFVIHSAPGDNLEPTLTALSRGLKSMKIGSQPVTVETRAQRRSAPPDLRPVFTAGELEALGAYWIGLAVDPVYADAQNDTTFPLLFRSLRRQLGHVLDRTFYAFAHQHTTHLPRHYHTLGRRAMVKAVWDIDRRLAAVSNSFDLLVQVTPINTERAWLDFKRSRCRKSPRFLYRPQTEDPGRMKRLLYDVPIERIEDPTLLHLFLEKQLELDRQLTLLMDLNSRAFLYGSFQLHGTVSTELGDLARTILESTSPRSRADTRGGFLDAAEFAGRARRETNWYRRHGKDFPAEVRVTDDLYAGLMVSRGRLLIGKETRVPTRRAEALLQHEVGTHLLTYFNGRAQPFRMLSTGLPGYDELQEGLAVLAEHLVGGLSADRLRVLAARVIAADTMAGGAEFVDVFTLLHLTYGIAQRTAYTISMRVFRGGGLMKDAVYLRGLVEILDYLGSDGALEPLFIGKIAASHISVIEELLRRRILTPTPALPRYLQSPDALARLARLRGGVSVTDLLPNPRRRTK